MEHRLIAVDFQNLMDAIGIAAERGGRIRMADQRSVEQFVNLHGLDPARAQMFAVTESLPMVTILNSGLMEGFYLYCAETERSFRYLVTDYPIRPLTKFGRDMCFDIALSYASEIREDVVEPLRRELEARGVRVYWLDVAEDPGEPLWGVRFREAVFRSYFFVPILTKHYLAREGTAVELFDFGRMTVKHRRDEFFYPMLPLVESHQELIGEVFSQRGVIAKKYDDQDFEWVRSHLMTLELAEGPEWLARFFASLAENAAGRFDSGFLECLGPKIEYVDKLERKGQLGMTLLIKNPVLTYYCFASSDQGVLRFMGLGEPQPSMVCLKEHSDPAGYILEYLGLPRREARNGPDLHQPHERTAKAKVLPFRRR